LGFFSFCFFAGMLIKRSAFALGFLFIWFIGVEIIPYSYLAGKFSKAYADSVYQFFPFGSLWTTIEEPITRLSVIQSAVQTVGEKVTKDHAVHWYEILIVLAWTAIFIYGSYTLLKKRDL